MIYIYYVVLRIHTIIYLHAIIYGCMMVAEGTRQQFFERILSQHLWSRGHPWSLVLPRWRSGCLHLGILYTFTGKWPVRMSVYTPMGGEARGNLQHLLINFPRTFLNNQRCYKWRWFGYGKNRFQWCLGFISGSIWVYDGCMSSSEPEGYSQLWKSMRFQQLILQYYSVLQSATPVLLCTDSTAVRRAWCGYLPRRGVFNCWSGVS